MASLPFRDKLPLQEKDGTAVADVPITVQPAQGQQTSPSGSRYDHDAVAAWEFAAALEVANRQIIWRGKRLRIIESVPMDDLPHVQLRLREVRSGG